MQPQKISFVVFLCLFQNHAHALDIHLPEDELRLPPLLNRVEETRASSDRLNITSLDQHHYQASVGEWLDPGDALDLPGRLAIQVIERENLQWVGGGVFQGKIGSGSSSNNDLVYELKLQRGWLRVWVKPDSMHSKIRITTEAGSFFTHNGVFWLNTRPGHTEVYLISGELTKEGSQTPLVNRNYAVYEKKPTDKPTDKPEYVSREWDPKALDVRIAAAYPHLVKLSLIAEEEWEAGKVSRNYAEKRKKGWRKASRF